MRRAYGYCRQLAAQRGWDVGISIIREVTDTVRGRTLCEYSDMHHIKCKGDNDDVDGEEEREA